MGVRSHSPLRAARAVVRVALPPVAYRLMLTGVCAEVDEKFTERVAEHGAQLSDLGSTVQQNNDRTADALAALVKRIAEKHKQQDSLAETRNAQLAESCARLDQSLATESARLGARCEEVFDVLDTKAAQLESMLQQQRQHFTELNTNADKKFTAKNAAQDELFDDHRRDVASVCTKLDSKFSADIIALDERMVADNQHFTQELEANASSFDGQLRDLGANLAHMISAADAQLRQKDADLDHAMREEFARISEQHGAIKRVFAEQVAAIEERTAANCATLDRKFTLENSEQHTRIEENHRHAVDVLAKLERQLLEMTKTLDDKFTRACTKLEQWTQGKLKVQGDRIEDEHAQWSESNSNLQKKLLTGLADLDKKATNTCAQLDAKFTDADSRCAERIDQHYSYFSGVCAGLDKKLVSAHFEVVLTLESSSLCKRCSLLVPAGGHVRQLERVFVDTDETDRRHSTRDQVGAWYTNRRQPAPFY
eukprot:COSAG05_NODE_1326_length_5179_cov_477.427756_2_plen_482_part_00